MSRVRVGAIAAVFVIGAALIAFIGSGSEPQRGQRLIGPTAVGPAPSDVPDRLFVRSTSDGVTIRARLLDEPSCYPPCATPYPYRLSLALSNDWATAHSVPDSGTASDESIVILVNSVFGEAEGSPASFIGVRVRNDVALVRAEYGDHVDRMEPVRGHAVLAVNRAVSGVRVQAEDASGKVIGTVDGVIPRPSVGAYPMDRLFRRTVEGVTIRGFAVDGVRTPFFAQLSDEAHVWGIWSPPDTGKTIETSGQSADGLGRAFTIDILAKPGVARVRARFPDGVVDEMEPVRGFAVLLHRGIFAGHEVTLEAIDRTGRVIATTDATPRTSVSTVYD